MQAAVDARRSFNLIHLATMFKVDVFVSRRRPFDASSFARVRHETLGLEPGNPTIPLASAEDVLLAKLEWYRRGGKTSERQWDDVKGLLRAGLAPSTPSTCDTGRRWWAWPICSTAPSARPIDHAPSFVGA